ncbi:MAG: AMP-binding protein, partial [bacterium]
MGMPEAEPTIPSWLANRAAIAPTATAIVAPGRIPLSYRRLYALIEQTGESLNRLGVGRNDRVSIVLPNGPEMAAAFLAVSSVATSAPLNPAYRANEFDFALSDLRASALIVRAGFDSPARAAARGRGVRIIELSPLL